MSEDSRRDTVLVIDDDPDIQLLIECIAQAQGVRILHAFDCVEGLNILKLERMRIKIILMDYFLPGMRPATCASAILASAGASIPIVLLTAAEDPASRALELKLRHWIAKPFAPSVLVNLLTQDIPF